MRVAPRQELSTSLRGNFRTSRGNRSRALRVDRFAKLTGVVLKDSVGVSEAKMAHRIRMPLSALAWSVLVVGGAWAADPVPAVPIVAVEERCIAAGYVDAYFGGGLGRQFDAASPTDGILWRDLSFGGAGRAAIQCAPRFSVQLDAWTDHWSGWYQSYDDAGPFGGQNYFERTTMGVGSHLTYHAGNLLAGVLASIGSVADWGTFANVGVEAAINTDRIMVEAQAGFTPAVFGFAANFDARDWYAQVRGAFYPSPNLSVSANVGVDFYSDTLPWYRRTLSWGAKLEFSLPARPIAVYVGYEGWHSGAGPDTTYGDTYAWEHAVRLGLRFLVGAPNLRELDRAVGLIDDNAIYGPAFGPTYFAGQTTVITVTGLD
jgi:hypothetical protein